MSGARRGVLDLGHFIRCAGGRSGRPGDKDKAICLISLGIFLFQTEGKPVIKLYHPTR
jgi:hypothetical protein